MTNAFKMPKGRRQDIKSGGPLPPEGLHVEYMFPLGTPHSRFEYP